MVAKEPKVMCQTPSPGKKPTVIARWKYDVLRTAILSVLPDKAPGMPLRELPERVAALLEPGQRARMGSIAWHTTVVKLDLEVKGDVGRVAGAGEQRLVRRKKP